MTDSHVDRTCKLSANKIYLAYRGHDGLPIDPPTNEENISAWYDRCGEQIDNCGDGLFKAIIHELMDCPDYPARAMRIMAADINSVLKALPDNPDDECFTLLPVDPSLDQG